MKFVKTMNKVSVDQFKYYKQPAHLQLSKKGKLYFLLTEVDEESDGYKTNLFSLNVGEETAPSEPGGRPENRKAEQEPKALAAGHNIEAYQLLDDGTVLVKALPEDGGQPLSVYYRLNETTDTLQEFLRIEQEVEQLLPIGSDRYLLTCSCRPKEKDAFFVTDEIPFWTDDLGYCNGRRLGLFLLEDGRLQKLTGNRMNVGDVRVFENRYAVFYGMEYEGVQPTDSKLYYLDLADFSLREIPAEAPYVYTAVLPIGPHTAVAVRSDKKKHGEYQDEFMDRLDCMEGRVLQRLNGDCAYHLYDDINTDVTPMVPFIIDMHWDGQGVYFLSTVEDSCHLMYGNFDTGEIRSITKEAGKVMDFQIEQGGEFAWISACRGLGGTELYRLCLTDGREECLTAFHGHCNDIFASLPESIGMTAKDGTGISGWVMKPLNFAEGQKYPAILYIHGGPNTAYGSVYFHEMQYLASEGYGIFYCNPRGSIGRGGEFADIRLKYGTVDYEDILEFTGEVLTKNPWIDEERLGITGGSYGGLMTNWVIGHTHQFRAAVSDRGVANHIYDFFMSDIGFSCVPDTFGVTPWEDGAFLWEQSPLRYAPFVKTPTLFLHGEEDYRCNKDQALQMFAALKYFGVPARAVIVKGEAHGLSREGKPTNRIRRLQEIKSWFDCYLKGKQE